MSILGLIPAKGGSTRLPHKNILPLGGKPLLAWTVDAVRASGLCDRLIVSTEDGEVAQVAAKLGVEALMRPEKLAKDPAGVVQVALHALDVLRSQGAEYDTLMIFLPTSPFRNAEDIRAAHHMFVEKKAEFLMSVSEFSHTPFAAMRIENDITTPWFPEYFGRKSQEMPAAYRPNGALHILDVPAFEREQSYVAQPLYAYVMPWQRSVDIDTAADLHQAEALLAAGVVHA
ncbi:MAG: acylneuraminate cytidylyltransferase family protein [Betaproteobacteria bacterium]|nr:acylneuraminate cytidylyltransferase family protein [Betaproteobacteria bacterium]